LKEAKEGLLTIVGTGILAAGQLTIEAKSYIQNADKVFYLVTDPIASRYIELLNPSAEDLHVHYAAGKPRILTYNEMVERIVTEVRKGLHVCVAFYGHPGVFVYPSHKAISEARRLGFQARMLPGVSAEDCLFADLGLDPGMGCQSFEATSFLVRKVLFDPHYLLILWQIGVLGDLLYSPKAKGPAEKLKVLADYLMSIYEEDCIGVVYEATFYPSCVPRVDKVLLSDLHTIPVSGISTLCIPSPLSPQVDEEMVTKLGVERQHLGKTRFAVNVEG